MGAIKLMTCIIVIVACVSMATARSRGHHGPKPHGPKPHGPKPHGSNPHGSNPHGSKPYGSKLPHLACEIRNTTDNSILKNVTCGCGDETPVDCTWGPLQVGDLQMTFCDLSDSNKTLPGVLSAACNVTNTTDTLLDDKCRDNETCTEGPLNITVEGAQYSALFCTHTQQQQRPPKGRADNDDVKEECVPLEIPDKDDRDSSSSSAADVDDDGNSDSNSSSSSSSADDKKQHMGRPSFGRKSRRHL